MTHRKIVDYKILGTGHLPAEYEVQELLKRGWQLYGFPIAVGFRDTWTQIQAMVKYEEKENLCSCCRDYYIKVKDENNE